MNLRQDETPSGEPTNAGLVCPICRFGTLQESLSLTGLPLQDGVVFTSQAEALAAPTGDIILSMCTACCYIQNSTFSPKLINFSEYQYPQQHSAKFRQHLDQALTKLAGDYGIRNRRVVDIGCGDGYFLRRLCREFDNHGVGIDPSIALTKEIPDEDENVVLISDEYSAQHEIYFGDLVSCRHVIEEVLDPLVFLSSIKNSLSQDIESIIYLEMPNALRTLEEKLIWNIGYAKRSWFTAASVRTLFHFSGLRVLEADTVFDDEYLGVIGRRARPGDPAEWPTEEEKNSLSSELRAVDRHVGRELQRWETKIEKGRETGEQIALWGAGMRGINFLSKFGDESVFEKIVDISPDRQGTYLPCSGYLVDRPEILSDFNPDRVLITNPNYESEIKQHLEKLGVECIVETL